MVLKYWSKVPCHGFPWTDCYLLGFSPRNPHMMEFTRIMEVEVGQIQTGNKSVYHKQIRVINHWNSLSRVTADSPSLEIFKSRVDVSKRCALGIIIGKFCGLCYTGRQTR